MGSKGSAVACLQASLGISADGDFGPKTEAAVKAFQSKAGLSADGVVGPLSIKALGK
jgi:peptidoglycan hydrolase-like protein with peptidoglycan-binding domain